MRSNSHVIGGFQRSNDPHSTKTPETRKVGVELNQNIVNSIVDKLGYSVNEVYTQVRHALQTTGFGEHQHASFVANLYFRMLKEE